MPPTIHEKFSSQAAPEVLTALRKIAESPALLRQLRLIVPKEIRLGAMLRKR